MSKAATLAASAVLSALVIAAQASAVHAPTAVYCPSPYASMVETLTSMEAQLQLGVDLDRYQSLLIKVRTAYNRLPTNNVSLACLNAIGIPTEQAMNNYIRALNSWIGCKRRVASGLSQSCVGAGAFGEASREIYWQRASASIEKAVNNSR